MPRVTTKADLIASANGKWDKLWKLIDSIGIIREKALFMDGNFHALYSTILIELRIIHIIQQSNKSEFEAKYYGQRYKRRIGDTMNAFLIVIPFILMVCKEIRERVYKLYE